MSDGESLAQAEKTIKGAATVLTNLFNVAAGPTALVGFLAEGVFKGIRLGISIHGAQQQANAALNARIRARSILRMPIVVNLGDVLVRQFYSSGQHRTIFPEIGQAFKREVTEFFSTDENPSAQTFRILGVACDLIPKMRAALKFPERDLQELLGVWLIPGRPNYRKVVLEYVRLFPEDEMTYKDHYNRLSDFWKDELELELTEIKRAQIEAQRELDQKVRKLVKDAILGDQGFANEVLGLAKDLKKISVEEKIDGLKKAKPTSPQPGDVQAEIDALTAYLGRLG